MNRKFLPLLLCAGLGATAALPAYAAGFCSLGTQTEGISVSNMTYEGAPADDCFGVASGNVNSVGDLNGVWLGDWTLLATDEGSGDTGSFGGLDFTLTTTGTTSGTWTLTVVDNGDPLDLPAELDFIGALKAGNEYALWLFDDVIVNATNDGTWEIVFTNKGGQIPALSHLTLFVREGDSPEECPEGSPLPFPLCFPPQETPEPATGALLGLALAGLAAWRRRSV